jgi:hypothetical protein
VALARRLLIALWHFVRYGVRRGRPASCTSRGAPKVHLTVSGLSAMLATGSPMTVRGGGVPCPSTASMAFNRMSPPLRSFAARCASLHHGLGPWARRIQGCGTIIRDATRELPLDFVHLTQPHEQAAVLGAGKVGLAALGISVKGLRNGEQLDFDRCAAAGAAVGLPNQGRRRRAAQVSELVPFVYSATMFGGRRPWLKCLHCGQRCRVIFGGRPHR